jgi:hypothetical protein
MANPQPIHFMGIETVLFVAALIVVGIVWSLTRKARRADGSDKNVSPPQPRN